MIRRVTAVALLLAVSLGACVPSPSKTPTDASASVAGPTPSLGETSPPPSPSAAATAPSATSPPGSLPYRVNIGNGTVSPLQADKLPLVRITAEVARDAVLALQRDSGWPADMTLLRDGHCVFLGWLEQYPMSMAPVPPPPSAVYLVRLVSTEGPGVPDTWVMVDATTSEVRSALGVQNLGSECGGT